MVRKNIFSNDEYNKILKKIELDIEEGWNFAIQSPYPNETDLQRGVYSIKSNEK